MSGSTITFTSDFGTREYYVGAVKGVLLETNPEARVIDISHDIPSHDILAGAFTLA
jgi:S-adenosyl-L-methionine hydrolase (adenosine-forming)